MIPLVKPFLPPKENLIPRIEDILYSGYISEGEAVYEFEDKFSKLIGNPYCISVNSGTAALHIALLLIGAGTGDEVISTALTAEPTNTTIALTGAKILFADVDINTGLIDPKSIKNLITERTKAIMVVHYAGMVCDMDEINKISKKYNIPVIEDAAHALMSKYKGKYIGNNSAYTCFSFQAIKHMTTVDGGFLCLKNRDEYIRAKKLRWFGLDKKTARLKNNIKEAGYKYHMNNVNATIGLVQMEHLNNNVLKYISNGQFYDDSLKNASGVTLIPYYNNTEPSYWLYTLKVERRADFIANLQNNGITASPLHLRNDKHALFASKCKLINLDIFYEEFVHIPCGWWVSNEDRHKIVEVIKKGW
ncbi:DegT/DnrJ/EryC1/StrS family aminotransferase [Metabacillus halosaccharovorans]|uniref:DegT/DnrJ/EryC1/StrS family aminotransferase n=1 Tax=Metabacillus halosaccharovorans TaxID=930124 RepID=A0ABT3DEF4_9BACI|nr:DegT/DnrJ/EryC1/StrS family aminotransferase [Metabacillus halosaccharovorans]MCV9885433.1 DegT/DnrJ/EryC1/StrS family aminotransferase [Metabacillus halosaccharovorans]